MGKALTDANRLSIQRQDLVAQMVEPELAADLSMGSNRKVGWWCKGPSFNPHPYFTWDSKVNHRHKGSGCPACKGSAIIPGWNDLGTLRPDLARQLLDKKLAATLRLNTHERVKWVCSGKRGNKHPKYVWTAPVSNRTSLGRGCPACAGQAVIPGWNDLETLYPEIAEELLDRDLGVQLTGKAKARVLWICKKEHPDGKHRIWRTAVYCRTGGYRSGCPTCAKTGFDSTKPGTFYVISGTVNKMPAFKIGIANDHRLGGRLREHRKSGLDTLLAEVHFDSGAECRQYESDAKARAIEGGAMQLSALGHEFDGKTETFLRDRLGEIFMNGLVESLAAA